MCKTSKTRAFKLAALGLAAINLADTTRRIEFAAEVEIQASEASGDTPRKSRVSMLAYNGGPVVVPGYAAPVVIDLAGLTGLGRNVPILRDHDTKRVVGFIQASKANETLSANGQLTGKSADRLEIEEQAADGFPWQASVGVRPSRIEQVRAGKTALVNGRTVEGPAFVARESRLAEITITAIGADADTEVAVAAADLGDDDNGGDNGGGEGRPATPDFIGARREIERREAIEAAAIAQMRLTGSSAIPEIEAAITEALENGESAQQFELRMLRQFSRPAGDFRTGSRRDRQGADRQLLGPAMEAAVMRCLGSSASELEKHYKPAVLEAMDANPILRGDLQLRDVFVFAAEQNGSRDVSRTHLPGLLKAAFAPINASGISTIDIAGILSNVANKQMRGGFDSVADLMGPDGEGLMAYAVLGAVDSVSDFKEKTSYSLVGYNTYEKVAPGGELKHGKLGEESYANQADTYGSILGIDRRDLINDNLGALRRGPRMLGIGAAEKVAEVFWSVFMDNSTFYTAGRGNYDDGADTAFSIPGLTLAETLMMNQVKPNGKPLGRMPAIALTPTAIASDAANVFRSRLVNNGASGDNPSNNPHAGKYRPYSSPYLSNANFTGYSTLAWYLLCDPQVAPVIETVFLNGRQVPVIETTEADFQQLGVQMRGYHDFGVAPVEYRYGVKMKGEA
jgi:hypothetical protein